MKKEAVRTVSTIPVAPTTLYLAWLNPEQHAAMTNGGPAKINQTVGAKYSSHGGNVSGKLLVLDLGRRIIVSWRTSDFPRESPDSRVEIHLEALGASTRVTVLHTDIPEGLGEKTKTFWSESYFDPMRRYFSKYLPDPRLPPPPRPPPPPMDDDDDEEEEEEINPKQGKFGKFGKFGKKPAPSGPSVAKVPAKAAKPSAPPAKPSKAAPSAKPAAKPAAPAKPSKPAPKPVAKPAAKKPSKPAKPAPKPSKPVAKKPSKPTKPAPKSAKKPSKPAKPAPKKKR